MRRAAAGCAGVRSRATGVARLTKITQLSHGKDGMSTDPPVITEIGFQNMKKTVLKRSTPVAQERAPCLLNLW